jgi:hypothetical protein
VGEWFAQPLLLLLGPAAVLLLHLLERWRRRPLTLVVADLTLFEVTPEVEQAAASHRRRASQRFLLRAAAALALAAGVAGARWPGGSPGALTVDLVLDRGVSAGALQGAGTRLDAHREHLRAVLQRLRPDDRVRLHLLPARGPVAPLSPARAGELLTRATPLAATAEVAQATARLAPRAHAEGRPPVFVASDRPLPDQPGLALALAAEPVTNRALLSLTRDGDALHAALASYGAAGPAEVVFTVGDGEREVSGEVRLEVGDSGFLLVSWPLPADAPSSLRWARAELRGEDALPADDVVFATAPTSRRRVGILGEPGPWVRRALRAVPGTRLVELDRSGLEEAGDLDLMVVPSLALVEDTPGVALCVVPPSLSARAVAGGSVSGQAHAAFPHTLDALQADPFQVAQVGPLPTLRRAHTLLRAGERPLVVLSGEARRLVVAIAAPLDRDTSPWPELGSFPLFWAELLELAAPRTSTRLASHPCGEPWSGPDGAQTFFDVALQRDLDGAPLVGTSAAPPQALEDEAAGTHGFAEEALAAIDSTRPRQAPTPLGAGLALLALALALASWRPTAPARTGRR